MRQSVLVSPQTRVTIACSNRGGLRVELDAGYQFAIENWLVRVRFAYGPACRQIE